MNSEYKCFEIVEVSMKNYIGEWITVKPTALENAWDKYNIFFVIGENAGGGWVVHDEDYSYSTLSVDVSDIELYETDFRSQYEKERDNLIEQFNLTKEQAEGIMAKFNTPSVEGTKFEDYK